MIYILSIILSFIIGFLFNFCFGLLAFYTTSVWGMRLAKGALVGILSGQLIPIAFFPAFAQKILFALPFSSMLYTPVMIYIGKIEGLAVYSAIGVQLIWVAVFLFISSWGWKNAIKHLTIQGG